MLQKFVSPKVTRVVLRKFSGEVIPEVTANCSFPLSAMSHDNVYVVDATLINAYKNQQIPEWNKFVDLHAKLDKKFYTALRIDWIKQVASAENEIPKHFEEIQTDCPQPTEHGVTPFYDSVVKHFEVDDEMATKLIKVNKKYMLCSLTQ